MEVTCNRCHQTVQDDNCYCPACGLPQLVYAADGATVPAPSERWPEAVRDASSIDWKPGMRAALALAVPAGLLSSGISPLSGLGMVWMAGAAAWAVVLYIRSQRPAWITIGAGARIGLVTGLLAGWLAFGVSGSWLFVERVILHQSSQIDVVYNAFVDAFREKAHDSIAGMAPPDAVQVQATIAKIQAFILSPEGHAGIWAFSLICNCVFLVLFAVGGGALGARFLARSRRPEI
jgi:hypothetical protein